MSNSDMEQPSGSAGADQSDSTQFMASGERDALLNRIDPAHVGQSAIRLSIPGYRIVRVLGRGGMGTVYEAEQQVPRRSVALKVMSAGQASPSLLRRMEMEAQMLGLLHHPGIAQIYEAGTFDAGDGPQPFFAMELVEGPSLSDYAERRNPSIPERVELLARICDAVQHAHQKGVIHRDLKPDNILMEESGQPKVLDFGVARAVNREVTSASMQTRIGVVIGTVPYMSPEQIGGETDQLDTRADIYSLGVIGYELLSGHAPIDFTGLTLMEAATAIRERTPVPLSSHNRLLRGDLDTIIRKALEKDRARRYQSAAEFAADLRRYLNNEPIMARPPTAFYQIRKFAQRNKVVVFAAACVIVALCAGLSLALWQARVATISRNVADRARIEAEAAREEARVQAAHTQRAADFVMDIFQMADPEVSKKRVFTAREILDSGRQKLSADHQLDFQTRMRLRSMIGKAYRGIGDEDQALAVYRASLAEIRAAPARDTRAEVETLIGIGNLTGDRDHINDALAAARDAFELARVRFGEKDELYYKALLTLGWALYRGRLENGGKIATEEAARLLRAHSEQTAARYGEESAQYGAALNALARVLSVHGDPGQADEVEHLFIRSIEITEKFSGPTGAELAVIYSNLGGHYRSLDQLDKAEAALTKSLEIVRLAPDDNWVLTALKNLGDFYKDNRREDKKGIPFYEEYIKVYPRYFDVETPELSWVMQSLAAWYWRIGRKEEAADLEMKAYPIYLRDVEPCDPRFKSTADVVITVLIGAGRFDEACAKAREMLERSAPCGAQSLARADALSGLARALWAKGEREESKRLREEEKQIRNFLKEQPPAKPRKD